MRIAVYPFKSTGTIEENLRTIQTAVQLAAMQQVRLLVFHECALCGYPPVESSIEAISPQTIANGFVAISDLARKYQLYLAVGTVRFEKERRYDSIVLFDDTGKQIGCYDKTALWGWDLEHFERGNRIGIFEIDGFKMGFRICYDIRFPELFRNLYREQVQLCFVSFSDTANLPNSERYEIIKSHLRTRASENLMTVVSVNSLSRYPTAPTAVFDPDGRVVKEVPDSEELLIYDYERPVPTFSMSGRGVNSDFFCR